MKYRFLLSVTGCVAVLAGWTPQSKTASAASADCSDITSYTNSLEMLGSCRGPVGLSDSVGDSSAAYVTCLDKGLKAILVKDLADAIEADDKRKIQISKLSLETFKSYCKEVETELSDVHEALEEHVQSHVERTADAIWTRHWQPQFIDYIVDPTGYTRGLFSLDAWETMRSEILTTFDSQWFFDQKAWLSVSVQSQEIAALEDNRWQVDATIIVRLFLEDSQERFERELKERYVMGADAQHVSDTNLAGLFLLETDTVLKPLFEEIYERFPVNPKQEGKAGLEPIDQN